MKTNSRWVNLIFIIFMMAGLSALSPNETKAADLTVGSGCTYSTIAEAITAASPGDTIKVAAGTFYEALDFIDKNLTVVGGYNSACTTPGSGTTILNGQYHSRSVVDIRGSAVTMRDLQITGGNAIGGGVDADSGADVTLDNVLVTGNTGTYGAGLYVGSTAVVTLTNGTKIDNNTATIAGGGARVWGQLIVNSWASRIANNSAPNGGGVSVPGGVFEMHPGHVRENQATAADGVGGGIHVYGGGAITLDGSSNVFGNTAYNGAGIYADKAQIHLEAVVHGNTATNYGGGVYLSNDSHLNANHTSIGYHTISGLNQANRGAGMYVDASTVDFSGSIMNNIAANRGGGIHAQASTLTLTNASVGGTDTNQPNQLGSAGNIGAGLYFADGTQATLNNTVVSGNTFQTTGFTYGGGLYVTNGCVVTMKASRVENNLAPSATDGLGAGLYINSSTVTLDNSQITSNTAGKAGGGVRLWGTSTLNVLKNSIIANNHALNGQGGAVAAGGTPTINISNATLRDNSASSDGGAVYLEAGTLNVGYTHLHRNSAQRGGAIYQTGAAAATEVSNSLIYSNTSTGGFGAGIRSEGGAFTMTHVTLAHNVNGAGYSQSGTNGHAANSIAWGNDAGGFWVASGPLDGMCNIDQSGNIGMNADPLFVAPGAGENYRLQIGSPAIDACAYGLSPDLDNIPRPMGIGYDMGAYEFYKEYVVEAVINPGGGGTVYGTGTYIEGSTVTLNATANSGYVFVNWTEGNRVVSCSANYTFIASSDRILRANFSQVKSRYDITGTASPLNFGTVTGSGSYNHGAGVTMRALPNQGFALTNWIETWPGLEGYCVVSTDEQYSFSASRNRSLTAKIRPKTLPGVLMLLLDDE